MSFSIFGKKKDDKKSSLPDQKSTKNSAATTAQTNVNANTAENKITSTKSADTNNTSNALPAETVPVETRKTSTLDTDYLLDANTDRLIHHIGSIENISILEEAAILFAGKQVETAELILQDLLQDENTVEPDTDAWSMLFDLYQVTNNQIKFEQLRSDYADKWIKTTAPHWRTPQVCPTATDGKLLLPAIIEGDTQQLISSISDFAGEHSSVQLDCSQLARIDFTSCGQLLSGLMPIATMPGVSSIEFHDVNLLVNALLSAMGFKSIAKIFPRQH